MLGTENNDDNNSSSGSSSNGMFSPVLGRRSSLHDLFTPTPPSTSSNNSKPHPTKTLTTTTSSREYMSQTPPPPIDNNSLPRLADRSWLGAKVSPIPSQPEEESDDDDDDDEEIAIMAPYRRALKEASFVMGAAATTEETTLLGRNIVSHKRALGGSNVPQQHHHEQPHQHHSTFAPVTMVDVSLRSDYPTPLEETVIHNNGIRRINDLAGYQNPPGPYSQRQKGHPYDARHFLRRIWNFPRRFCQSRSVHLWIPIATALFLFSIGLHDAFLKYLAVRRGITISYTLAWSIPWLGPSQRSMSRFGAFCPQQIFPRVISEEKEQGYALGEYWRILTSALWATSSVAEWGLLLLAWWWAIPPFTGVQQQQQHSTAPLFLGGRQKHDSVYNSSDQSTTNDSLSLPMSTTTKWPLWWPFVYSLSTFTGQLWMVAFDYYRGDDGMTISGCTSWGTAGVLCAKGIQWPDRRLELFVLAIVLVLLNLFQTTTASVFGAIGASFFGWAYAGIWSTNTTTTTSTNKKKRTGGGASSRRNSNYSYNVDDGNSKEAESKTQHCTRRWTSWNMVATICTVSLWVVPLVNLLAYW